MTKGICPKCHVPMLLVTDGFFCAECKQSLKSKWPAISGDGKLTKLDHEFLKALRIRWDEEPEG